MELFVPVDRFSGEFSSKGSKFIALGFPVESAAEVKAILNEIRSEPEYKAARHFCYAYRLGCPVSDLRANDDGEPSGTAGKPILHQIESHQFTNVLVVVVRFFGGVLLGTGGLIQAYREASSAALKNSETQKIEPMDEFEVSGEFSLQSLVENSCKNRGGMITQKSFGNGFIFHLKISSKKADEWANFLAETTHQKLSIKKIKNC